MANKVKPGLIILDVMMPDLNGIDASRQIRAAGDAMLLILNGDLPTLKPATLSKLISRHRRSGAVLSVLTAEIDAELARLREEEERKAAEAARQKALLDEVLSSLQKAVEETKSLSVETEGIEEVQEESDIVD